MFNIYLDYPDPADEKQIVMTTTSAYEPQLNAVITSEEILRLQQVVRKVPIAESIVDYAVALSHRSRPNAAGRTRFYQGLGELGGGSQSFAIPCARSKSASNYAWSLSCLLR